MNFLALVVVVVVVVVVDDVCVIIVRNDELMIELNNCDILFVVVVVVCCCLWNETRQDQYMESVTTITAHVDHHRTAHDARCFVSMGWGTAPVTDLATSRRVAARFLCRRPRHLAWALLQTTS